jgi:hypothetical protein
MPQTALEYFPRSIDRGSIEVQQVVNKPSVSGPCVTWYDTNPRASEGEFWKFSYAISRIFAKNRYRHFTLAGY